MPAVADCSLTGVDAAAAAAAPVLGETGPAFAGLKHAAHGHMGDEDVSEGEENEVLVDMTTPCFSAAATCLIQFLYPPVFGLVQLGPFSLLLRGGEKGE